MSVEVSKVRGISWEDLESLRQEKTQLAIRHPYSNFLILSEPKPTFTGGKRADDSELLPSAPNSGAAIHRASRGGRWTFHGPGQMLIYPIFRLTEFGFPSRGVRPFLDRFSAGIVEWLEGLGLKAALGEPFGIYVDGKKIAAFGLSLERGVTSHGAALYLAPQQSAFKHIHPCGVPGQKTTSLLECGVRLSWEEVSAQIVETLKKSFLPDSDWAYNVGTLKNALRVKTISGECHG
ncbi:MAG: lipoyl(octanoyl) transferase LipB [Bdellovibrionaceae bacterium]|nr:lipoyl(octanoyl) transferase LipB [Pseudobdellovibrionaceae bacterium]